MNGLKCKPEIAKLLRAASKKKTKGDLVLDSGEELLIPFDYSYMSHRIGESLAELYWQTLRQLVDEVVPRHCGLQLTWVKFWSLFREVGSGFLHIHRSGALEERITRFEMKCKRSLFDYDVVFLYRDLDMGPEPLEIGPVRIVQSTHRNLRELGMNGESSWLDTENGDAPGSLAITKAQAADKARAHEVGMSAVSYCLDVLKMAVLNGLANCVQPELLLQWRPSGIWSTLCPRAGAPSASWDWKRQFGPITTNLRQAANDGLEAAPYSDILKAALPEDARRRLKWAMDWILRSVEQEDQDQKIVDLCTALEIMLLPAYKTGKKWEPLCLRYRLLGGNLTSSALFGLYQMRLNLVHSSTLGVASPQETWTLRSVCDTVFRLTLQRFKENPQTGSLEELMERIETVNSLQAFLDQWYAGAFQGRGVKKLVKYAADRLEMALSLQ